MTVQEEQRAKEEGEKRRRDRDHKYRERSRRKRVNFLSSDYTPNFVLGVYFCIYYADITNQQLFELSFILKFSVQFMNFNSNGFMISLTNAYGL